MQVVLLQRKNCSPSVGDVLLSGDLLSEVADLCQSQRSKGKATDTVFETDTFCDRLVEPSKQWSFLKRLMHPSSLWLAQTGRTQDDSFIVFQKIHCWQYISLR